MVVSVDTATQTAEEAIARAARKTAEEAIAWASAPCPDGTHRTNYAHLLETVCRGWAKGGGAFDALSAALSTGMGLDMWPCLSRLLAMDEPALVESVRPRYCEALDCQAASAWLQLQFAAVTGRRPAVRSWRNAPRRGCASL